MFKSSVKITTISTTFPNIIYVSWGLGGFHYILHILQSFLFFFCTCFIWRRKKRKQKTKTKTKTKTEKQKRNLVRVFALNLRINKTIFRFIDNMYVSKKLEKEREKKDKLLFVITFSYIRYCRKK